MNSRLFYGQLVDFREQKRGESPQRTQEIRTQLHIRMSFAVGLVIIGDSEKRPITRSGYITTLVELYQVSGGASLP